MPSDAKRVSDADRGMVAGQLKKAHAEGRLDLNEFDERTRLVWEARTFGELAAVTADLPMCVNRCRGRVGAGATGVRRADAGGARPGPWLGVHEGGDRVLVCGGR